MRKLKDLLRGLEYKSNAELDNISISRIKTDSRLADKDDLFVAVEGGTYNGHDFIIDAAKKGISAVISSIGVTEKHSGIPTIFVHDTKRVLARLASNYYNNPSSKIKIIGVTGTNGKTTVSYLMEAILKSAGYRTGLIGTINYRIEDKVLDAVNTTPQALLLNDLLREMVDNSLERAVMEVSSHALDQSRTHAIDFDTAIFTNITPEHLDYHKTFQAYLNAKKSLFAGLSLLAE